MSREERIELMTSVVAKQCLALLRHADLSLRCPSSPPALPTSYPGEPHTAWQNRISSILS